MHRRWLSQSLVEDRKDLNAKKGIFEEERGRRRKCQKKVQGDCIFVLVGVKEGANKSIIWKKVEGEWVWTLERLIKDYRG